MQEKGVITIARQFGSGGREIGKTLAGKLGYSFYDRELLSYAAEKSGVRASVFENADERMHSRLLAALEIDPTSSAAGILQHDGMATPESLFAIQSDAIRELAALGGCLIVGRCADYILRERPGCLRVFIHAPMEERIARIKQLYELTRKQAEQLILKTDKSRQEYYSFYTGERWSDADNYHLSVDSAALGSRATVEYIKDFFGSFLGAGVPQTSLR